MQRNVGAMILCEFRVVNGNPTCFRCGRSVPMPKNGNLSGLDRKCTFDAPKSLDGPGDYLHAFILKWLGQGTWAGCGCANKIAEMNALGPVGCREQLESMTTYLCGKADELGWFSEPTENARRRIRWWKFANKAGKLTQSRGTVVRQMILHAVRKSEKAIRSNLQNAFDRVVVVNLKRRADRLDLFNSEIAKQPWPFKQPEVFEAIDGSVLPEPQNWPAGRGAWGCMRSHQAIIERAIIDGVDRLLILEDDLILSEDFAEKAAEFMVKVPGNWDGIMFGGQHMKPPLFVRDGVDRCVNATRTHAYALRGGYMRALLHEWYSKQGHCDLIMGDIHANWHVYAPAPFLCGQRGTRSDISGRWDANKFWAAGQETWGGPLSRNQLLIFELGRECNLGPKHAKCPNMHPERFAGLDTSRELDDETIVQCAADAYLKYDFHGMVGWHYYNEPTLQAERMIRLMDAIKSRAPEARFILWTNGTNAAWIRQNRWRFAHVHQSGYQGDPHGEQLDDRLIRLDPRGDEPCLRPFCEFILDCHGNHHPCCFDWRGEASIGNVFEDGFEILMGRWEAFQIAVCRDRMTEHAPEACRRCGRRPDCGNLDRDAHHRAMEWRAKSLP